MFKEYEGEDATLEKLVLRGVVPLHHAKVLYDYCQDIEIQYITCWPEGSSFVIHFKNGQKYCSGIGWVYKGSWNDKPLKNIYCERYD